MGVRFDNIELRYSLIAIWRRTKNRLETYVSVTKVINRYEKTTSNYFH